MFQLLIMALRNLGVHFKRTLISGGAIAVVTALLVFMLCLSSGVQTTIEESSTALFTGHLNVWGFRRNSAGRTSRIMTDFEAVEKIVRKSLPDLESVTPRGQGRARLSSEGSTLGVATVGIDPNQETRFKQTIQLVEGSLDELSKPGSILLFEWQAKKLAVRVGDVLTVVGSTPRGVANTVDARIVGIARDLGELSSDFVFLPKVTFNSLYQLNDDTASSLFLYLKNQRNLISDREKLRVALAEAGYSVMDLNPSPSWRKMRQLRNESWTGQKLDLSTWKDETSDIQWVLKAIDGLAYLLTLTLLLVSSMGIMNFIWIAIRERTREIGTLRAIGMQKERVALIFICETFALSVLSTLVGATLALFATFLLNAWHVTAPRGAEHFLMSKTLSFSTDPSRLLFGILLIIGCTTLISVIPSLRAARMKPITAMQHIG